MRWLLALILAALVTISRNAGASASAPYYLDYVDGGDALADSEWSASGAIASGGSRRAGAGVARGRSWFTIAAFDRVDESGREIGVLAVLGLALDRIAAGPVHALADRPGPPSSPPPEPPKEPRLSIDALLARGAVAAAWRTSGLGVDDAKVDAIIARARYSAMLPETRLRALRLVDEQGRTDSTPATDTLRYTGTGGASLWLEARLTWHLDRLLYADDEPTLERVRLERIDARARMAAKVLDLVFQWQRARLDQRDAPAGTREELDATLRVLEAQIALDVVTGGWFSKARAASQAAAQGGTS